MMIYKPNKQTMIEQHKPEEYDEEEDTILEPEQPEDIRKHRQPEVNVNNTLPTLYFNLELKKGIAITLTAVGSDDEKARESFELLLKQLDRINLNDEETKKEGKGSYIG